MWSIPKKRNSIFLSALQLIFIVQRLFYIIFNFAFYGFPKDFKLIKMHEQIIFKTDPRTLWISLMHFCDAFIKRIDKLLTYCKYWICRLTIFLLPTWRWILNLYFIEITHLKHLKIMFFLLTKKKKKIPRYLHYK